MCCTSLRRVIAMIAFGSLAVLLAGTPNWAQVGGGPGGGGKGKRGFAGPGGMGGPAAPPVILPEGLNHVPADATAFAYIRVADSLNGMASQALLKQLRPDGEQGKLVAQIEKRLGVRLADVESITVFHLEPPTTALATRAKALAQPAADKTPEERPGPLVALTYAQPVNRKAVLRALSSRSDSVLPRLSGMFLSDRCVLFGSPADLVNYTAPARRLGPAFDLDDGPFGGPGAQAQWGGPRTTTRTALSAALALGAEPHLIVAGAQVPVAARAKVKAAAHDGTLGPYGALLPLQYTTIGLTVDVRNAAEVTLRFMGGDQLTLEAVQALRTLAELALDEKDTKLPITLSPELHKAVQKAVAQATVDRVAAGQVEMRLRLETNPDEWARALATAVVGMR
jgi:hypothetical protein